MSDAPSLSTAATAAAILLAASLIAAAATPGMVAGGAVAGGFAAGDSESVDSGSTGSVAIDSAAAGSVAVDSVGPEAAATDRTAVTSDPSPDSDAIAPDLRASNGTVEVVVRFAGDASPGADSGGDAGSSERSPTLSADDLKANAASAQADFESFAERKPGVTVERSFWLANAMLVTVDTESAAVERLLDVRGVKRVHENFEVTLDSATTTSGGDGSQAIGAAGPQPAVGPGTVSTTATGTNATYGVEMVRAPEVWEEFGTRGEGATVAVLDTGIDPDHPDLNVSGWAEIDKNGDVIQDDDVPYDLNGHGTHVAGTVAGGNTSGTAIGVAPEAKIHAIKVFPEDSRSASFTRVIGGMEAALNESVVGDRADILQMSLGADGYHTQMIEPVRNANNAGAIVIASSGNKGENSSSSPANVYDSLAVGAVDTKKNVASFSSGEDITTDDAWVGDPPNEWPEQYVVPDVSAPGVGINSSVPGGEYDDTYSGTSMAAPHVSGVAALMLSASTRNVSDDELFDTLRDTATHPDNASDPDDRYGTGVVDGYAAVSSITENHSNLTVTEFDAPAEIAPGETLATTATINNTGADPGAGTVEYRFNDTVGDTANVSLAPGENATVGFSYVIPSDTETNQSYDHGVHTADSNRTTAIDVVDKPLYGVTDLSAPAIVERNATLSATANVTNRGTVAGDNRTVELRLADPENASRKRALDAANVSLAAGENATIELNGTVPSEFGTGATELTVTSPEEAVSAPVRVAKAIATVNGTVTDAETNATLSGIEVHAKNENELVGETLTGADGTYAVDVPAANLTVTASNATYAPAGDSVTLSGSGDTATTNLSLSLRNGTISGVVNASDELDPPANATVTVANETGHAVATIDAAANGTYGTELRPGTYDLTADAPDFDPDDVAGVSVEPNATATQRFALGPLPATLSGTVIGADTDAPIEGATVIAAPEVGGGSVETATGAAGNYSLGADRGNYDLTASAEGYVDVTRTVSLPSNGSVEENVSLATPANFTVTDLSGPGEIERGQSADVDVTVENVGGSSDDVTVALAVSPGDASDSRSFSGVASGATRATTFSVSIADGGETGTYDVTASTPDDSESTIIEVVSGESGDDGGSGGGGSGAGGGGGSGASPSPAPPSTEDPDEPENETDGPMNETESPTNETDSPTNATDVPANVTDDPTNETDEPVNDTGEPIDDGPRDGDDQADAEDDGNDESDIGPDEPTDGASGGDDTASEDESVDGAPGFGPAVGVLALLAATLLVGRRGRRGGNG